MSTQDNAETSRLKFLSDVAQQTSAHLQFTCDRVFALPMSLERRLPSGMLYGRAILL